MYRWQEGQNVHDCPLCGSRTITTTQPPKLGFLSHASADARQVDSETINTYKHTKTIESSHSTSSGSVVFQKVVIDLISRSGSSVSGTNSRANRDIKVEEDGHDSKILQAAPELDLAHTGYAPFRARAIVSPMREGSQDAFPNSFDLGHNGLLTDPFESNAYQRPFMTLEHGGSHQPWSDLNTRDDSAILDHLGGNELYRRDILEHPEV